MRSRRWFGLALCVLTASFIGCGSRSVEEDRSITWSPDGKGVAFQHGESGVFIVGDDGELLKIHEPEEGELAASSPLWAPSAESVIFTTARTLSEDSDRPIGSWAASPAGRRFQKRMVVYTCWLRDASSEGKATKPHPLFEATVDHVGYVAANLAVRWRPDGRQIWFIQQVNESEHGIFAYDLKNKTSSRVTSLGAAALLFDWSPDGEYLGCMLSERADDGDGENVSVLVQRWGGKKEPDDKWWVVPGTVKQSHVTWGLASLMANKPVWAPTGGRFAMAASQVATANWEKVPVAADESATAEPATSEPATDEPATSATDEPATESVENFVRVADASRKQVTNVWSSKHAIRDMRWSPDGATLGFRDGDGEQGALRLITLEKKRAQHHEAIDSYPVRHFAGWDSTGQNIAYVTSDELAAKASEWAFVLYSDPHARDQVVLADRYGKTEEIVFDGMRVTFPLWSPKERKLSVWFTFQPSHETWLQLITRWGLSPGDPAATLNVDTKEIVWHAISGEEKIQVGHYYAIQKDFKRAWHWYEEASKEVPPIATPTLEEFTRQIVEPTNFEFFKYHCLTQLGRHDEAQQHLQLFRDHFFPVTPDGSARPSTSPPAEVVAEVATVDASESGDASDDSEPEHRETTNPRLVMTENILSGGEGARVTLRHTYEAQALLSIGGVDAARDYFSIPPIGEESVDHRLSRNVILAQLLLLERDYDTYAHFVTDNILPAMIDKVDSKIELSFEPFAPDSQSDESADVLFFNGILTLLPIYSSEFLSDLSSERLVETTVAWEQLATRLNTKGKPLVDLHLRAAYAHQWRTQDLARVEQQIAGAGIKVAAIDRLVVEAKRFRETMTAFAEMMQLLGN